MKINGNLIHGYGIRCEKWRETRENDFSFFVKIIYRYRNLGVENRELKNKGHFFFMWKRDRDQIVQLEKQRSVPVILRYSTPKKKKDIIHIILTSEIPHQITCTLQNTAFFVFFCLLLQEEDPETLGEVTGNKGKSCGCGSLGVVIGDIGCK